VDLGWVWYERCYSQARTWWSLIWHQSHRLIPGVRSRLRYVHRYNDTNITADGLLKLAASLGRVLEYVSCDVSSPASVTAAMEQATRVSPHPIRGLVTCAGISGKEHAISYSHEAFKRILDVNVTGTFLCAQAIARIMHEQHTPGSIVLIASMSGTVANKGVETVAYNSSKAAVLQMARNLAAEWGNDGIHPTIRVNTVSPGYIQTPITMPTVEATPGLRELWEGGNMLGRLSEVHEHLSGIVYLLADGSSYVTGADIRADGGHCAW
jgi:NAD(P)-dependent dehydrogenase (short-subunit alcohol dehydrogenase family)